MDSSLHSRIAHGLDTMFSGYDGPSFALRLWDGWEWTPAYHEEPRCTIVIETPEALTDLFSSPDEITLGEAFIHRDIDVEGDFFSVFPVAEHVFNLQRSLLQETSARMLKTLSRSARPPPYDENIRRCRSRLRQRPDSETRSLPRSRVGALSGPPHWYPAEGKSPQTQSIDRSDAFQTSLPVPTEQQFSPCHSIR